MAQAIPQIPKEIDKVKTEINHFFNYLIAFLNQRRLEILNKLHEINHEKESRIRMQVKTKEELESLKRDTEQKLYTNILRETQERILREIQAKLTEVNLPKPETRIVFRGATHELKELIKGVGEVVEEEVLTVPRYKDMKPIVAVAKPGKAQGELWYATGVTIDSATNLIYIAEGHSNDEFSRVSVFSEMGDYLKSYFHEDMQILWGIAIRENNLYLTDCGLHTVFHFKIGSTLCLVGRQGSLGSDIGQFHNPNSLTISPDGDLYIADVDNKRVQILDETLQPIRVVTHPSMKSVRDVKLTADEMYVLSNRDSPCVHVFSLSGDQIRTMVTCGEGMLVKNAHFFCLDEDKNIIICDWEAHRIRIFSNEGEVIRTIGEYGAGVGEFNRPFGVALTSSLKLVIVSLHTNYVLQIFA